MKYIDIIRREFAHGHGFRMTTSYGYVTYYPCPYSFKKCRAVHDYVYTGHTFTRLVSYDTVVRNFYRFTDIIIH